MNIIKKCRININLILCLWTVMLVVASCIYPLLSKSMVWMVIELYSILTVAITMFKKTNNIILPKLAVLWSFTLFPVIINSYALKLNQIGFTLLWISLIILLIEVSYSFKWSINAVFLIGILTGIYALSTVLFNLNINMGLTYIARFFRTTSGDFKIAGFTDHYSHNGMYISIGAIVWFSYGLITLKKKYWALTALFVLALLFTQKRGPLLALLAAMLFSILIVQKGNFSKRIINTFIICFVVFILAFVVYIFAPSVFSVLDRFKDNGNMLTNREYMWDYAIKCFKDKPLIGYGWAYCPNNMNLYISGSSVVEMNIHNVYLQLLAETGVIGTVLFIIPMIMTIKKNIKILSLLVNNADKSFIIPPVYALGMQVFFIVYSITGNPLYDRQTLIPYMLSVAIVISYCCNIKYLVRKNNEKS